MLAAHAGYNLVRPNYAFGSERAELGFLLAPRHTCALFISRAAIEWTTEASSCQSAAVSPRGSARSLVTGRMRHVARWALGTGETFI
jgi:hypothetical protein